MCGAPRATTVPGRFVQVTAGEASSRTVPPGRDKTSSLYNDLERVTTRRRRCNSKSSTAERHEVVRSAPHLDQALTMLRIGTSGCQQSPALMHRRLLLGISGSPDLQSLFVGVYMSNSCLLSNWNGFCADSRLSSEFLNSLV
jgi:hypothetical protein